MQEAGLAGFEKGLWLGVLAPAGTPAEVVGRLHASMTEILQTPDVRARIEKAGFQVLSEPPEVFRKRLARDAEQWGEVIRRNRISAD
jgi:tripartite-type tricarboxylate transporter receptor subunit TctC